MTAPAISKRLSACEKFVIICLTKVIFKKLMFQVKAKIFVKKLQSPLVILKFLFSEMLMDSWKYGNNRTVYNIGRRKLSLRRSFNEVCWEYKVNIGS